MKLSKWFGGIVKSTFSILRPKALMPNRGDKLTDEQKDEIAYSRALAHMMRSDFDASQGNDPFDVEDAVAQFSSNPWVYSTISARKDAVAGIPWRVMMWQDEKDAEGNITKVKVPVPDSEAQKILDHPNNRYSGYELREAVIAWEDLTGDAYWEILRKDKKIVGLVYLRSDRMQIIPDPQKIIDGYMYVVNGRGQRLETTDVVHFKRFTPTCEYKGQGSLQAAERSLGLDDAAIRWMRDLFDHGAKMGGVLRYKDFLTDAQYARAKGEMETWEGARKRHRLMLLEGDANFQPDTSAPKDMEFAGMREWDRREVLAATDVPPIMVGDKDATYANGDAQKDIFWTAILSTLQGLAETITHQFLVYFDSRYFLEFDTSVVPYLAEAERKRKEAEEDAKLSRDIRTVQSNLMTVNEWREENGLEAVPWGDLPFSAQAQAALAGMGIGVPPEAQQVGMIEPATETETVGAPATAPAAAPVVSLGLTPSDLGAIVTVDEARASIGLKPLGGTDGAMTLDEFRLKNKTAVLPDKPDAAPEVKSLDAEPGKAGIASDPKAVRKEAYEKRRAARIAGWKPTQRRNENKFFAAMQKFFEGQQARVIAKLKGATKSLAKALRKDDFTDDDWDDLWDDATENEELGNASAKFFEDMVRQSGQGAVSELKAAGVFNVTNPEVGKWLKEHEFKFTDQVNGTTTDRLRATLAEGYKAGEGADALTARVEAVFADTIRGSASRARNIARTESIHAMNAGAFAGYKQVGVEKKEWLPTVDYRTREGHAEMEGVVIDFDKPFKVPVYSAPTKENPVAQWMRDDEMMFPLDDSLGAGPENICQCRCSILPILADEE